MTFSKSLLMLLTFSFLFLSQISFSQELQSKINKNTAGHSITGVIIDSLTNKPVEFGNFVLYRLKDSTIVYGSVSDKEGRFSISNVPPGVYYARISFIGYKTRRRNKIVINTKTPSLDLDTIRLSPRSISTAEVQVTAEKDRIIHEDDKIILKVDKSVGINAMDVLENSPMVDVDIDGKVSLMGRQGTLIYIDGMPAKYSGVDKVDDLKVYHVSEIDKIELIPNPSLEFEERSAGGIINIITKKTSSDKYSAATGLNMNTRNNLSSIASLKYNSGIVSISGRYGNNYTRLNNESSSHKEITLNGIKSNLDQSSESENKANSNNFVLGFNLNGDKNMLTVSTNYRNIFTDVKRTSANDLFNNRNAILENYLSNNSTKNQHHFFSAHVNYTRSFEQKGKSLKISFGYVRNSMGINNNISQDNYLFAPEISKYTVLQNNTSDNKNRTFLGSVFFSTPLNQAISLRSGIKSRYTELSMNNIYNRLDQSENRYIEDLGKKLGQKNNERILSAFCSITGKLFDIRYDAGLSFENKYQESKETVSGSGFDSEFSKLIPSISLSRKFSDDQSLSLGFLRDYVYPQNRQLNPHVDYSDSSNIITGNPGLQPYYMDLYTISYTFPFGGEYLNLGGYFAYYKDNIEQITTQLNSKTSVTTYRNIASYVDYGVGISTGKKFFGWMNLQPEIYISETRYSSPYSNNRSFRFSSNLKTSLSFNNLKLQLNQHYSTGSISAQQKSRPAYYANAMMKILFFDKALSVSLKAEDIFSTKNLNKDRYGTGFYSINNIRQTTRIISLDLSYYFYSKANDSIDDRPDQEEYDDDF